MEDLMHLSLVQVEEEVEEEMIEEEELLFKNLIYMKDLKNRNLSSTQMILNQSFQRTHHQS